MTLGSDILVDSNCGQQGKRVKLKEARAIINGKEKKKTGIGNIY